jgi:hypothetical protein
MDPVLPGGSEALKEMALYESLVRNEIVDLKDGKSEIQPELVLSCKNERYLV